MSQYIDSAPSSFKLVVHLFSVHSENDSFLFFDLLIFFSKPKQTYTRLLEHKSVASAVISPHLPINLILYLSIVCKICI